MYPSLGLKLRRVLHEDYNNYSQYDPLSFLSCPKIHRMIKLANELQLEVFSEIIDASLKAHRSHMVRTSGKMSCLV